MLRCARVGRRATNEFSVAPRGKGVNRTDLPLTDRPESGMRFLGMEGLKYNPGTDGPTGRDEAWEL